MSENWADLSEKLQRLGLKFGLEKKPEPQNPQKMPVQQIINGRFLQTPFGEVFSADHYYAHNYIQGNAKIRPSLPIERLAKWAGLQRFEPEHYDDFIFLDTETTGLSGGTGTMAFMVGAARFGTSGLQLEQFFLQNPAEEFAMLDALAHFCEGMKAVVSYNGKAFDVPILNARFILNGMESPFEGLPHFDLLPITRRVWKARLAQCNLGNIEHHILGLERERDEVPGYLVPEIYMDYLRSGDASPLQGIFKHNENDVVSLAALFSTLNDLLENPLEQSQAYASDKVSIGRLMGSLGNEALAVQLYETGNSLGGDRYAELTALLQLAAIRKKHQDWEQAIPLWQKAADFGSVSAMLELAKHYEHKTRDYSAALSLTESALSFCKAHSDQEFSGGILNDLQKRQKRLKQKIQQKPNA
ncbi:MAG: ribonuclease H-like domain-containing protein [Anaerolineaceae bacterium]|nr:ribonuclease H-like domain-containing protein [Anaerolineaceae bacterium]